MLPAGIPADAPVPKTHPCFGRPTATSVYRASAAQRSFASCGSIRQASASNSLPCRSGVMRRACAGAGWCFRRRDLCTTSTSSRPVLTRRGHLRGREIGRRGCQGYSGQCLRHIAQWLAIGKQSGLVAASWTACSDMARCGRTGLHIRGRSRGDSSLCGASVVTAREQLWHLAYREASTLAFADAFRAIMLAFLVATVLVPLMRKAAPPKPAAAASAHEWLRRRHLIN